MPTSYSAQLRLAKPADGELDGTWGSTVNDEVTEMLEDAIAGIATIDVWTTNNHTLTTNNGTTDEARCAILILTDTTSDLTGAGTLTVPTAGKFYIVYNNTGETITVKTAAGTGVDVLTGFRKFVYCDGTNVERAEGMSVEDISDRPASGAIVAADTIPIDDGGVLSKATFTQMITFFDANLSFNNYSHPNHTGVITTSGDGAATLNLTAITDQTDIGAAIAGTDEIIINDDGTGLRRSDMSRVATYVDSAIGPYNNYSHPNHTGQVTSTGDGATVLDVTAITDQPASGALTSTDTMITNDGGVISESTFAQVSTFIQSEIRALTTSLTAYATGGQANATEVSGFYNEFTTVATAGDSAKLPAATAEAIHTVVNSGAAAMDLFPNTSDNLGEGVDTAVSLAVGESATYYGLDTTNWVRLGGGGSVDLSSVDQHILFAADNTYDVGASGTEAREMFSETFNESSATYLKTDIEDVTYGLADFLKLRPVTYTRKTSGKREIGLLAEDVAKVIPELVYYDDEGKPRGINYSRGWVLIVQAMKELTGNG